jgi:hypothetical protein
MRKATIIATTCILLGLLVWRLAADPRKGEDKYFMIVFASQAEPVVPRNAHTFATFVRPADRATEIDGARQDAKILTISWLPASMDIVPVRLTPEAGKNLDLAATLKWAKDTDARVVAWGPFEIKKGLFELARQQIDRLDRGGIGYKALDLRFRGAGATNCIHAVSDTDMENGFLATGTAFGEAASYLVLRHLQRWIVDPQKTYPEIAERLKLTENNVRFQDFTGPRAAEP